MNRHFAFAAMTVLLLWVSPVQAGHYDLVDCPEITTAAENEILATRGIHTTKQLLEAVAPAKGRQRLGRRTRISSKRLRWLANFCDLLRIRGVGPIMVRLLQATGVPDIASLAKEDPAALLPRVSATNKKYGITDPPPALEHLKVWVEQARALPVVVE